LVGATTILAELLAEAGFATAVALDFDPEDDEEDALAWAAGADFDWLAVADLAGADFAAGSLLEEAFAGLVIVAVPERPEGLATALAELLVEPRAELFDDFSLSRSLVLGMGWFL